MEECPAGLDRGVAQAAAVVSPDAAAYLASCLVAGSDAAARALQQLVGSQAGAPSASSTIGSAPPSPACRLLRLPGKTAYEITASRRLTESLPAGCQNFTPQVGAGAC